MQQKIIMKTLYPLLKIKTLNHEHTPVATIINLDRGVANLIHIMVIHPNSLKMQ